MSFCQSITVCDVCQIVEFFKILRFLCIILMGQSDHKVIGVHSSKFCIAEVHKPLDIGNLLAHGFLYVERRFYIEKTYSAKCGEQNRGDYNGSVFSHDEISELLKTIAYISFKTFRHIG